jgi:hypothetical protein
MIGIKELEGLSPAETEALLDVTQLTLDIIGIVEPTPFADSTSALISIYRHDWWGSLISGVSIIPYAGDLAKLAKIQSYVHKVRNALNLARTHKALVKPLQAVMQRLLVAMRKLPLDRLPPHIRQALDQIEALIADFLPRAGRPLTRIEHLTDQLLKDKFGMTRNVGLLQRRNAETVVAYFSKHGVPQAKWADLITGIDLHAIDAVTVVNLPPGTVVGQYFKTSDVLDGRHSGEWMTLSRSAATPDRLGISAAGRSYVSYQVTKPVEVLKSKAAGVADTWTPGRNRDVRVPRRTGDTSSAKAAELTRGGGQQYFLPAAWSCLKRLP